MGRVLLTARERELAWLDLKVAEALGGVWCQHPLDSEGRAVAAGEPYLCEPDWPDFKLRPRIPRPINADDLYDGPEYSTDWSVTGPLIEDLDIALIHATKHDQPKDEPRQWLAYRNGGSWVSSSAVDVDTRCGSWGETPLIAVCNLLMALAAAGELKGRISP